VDDAIDVVVRADGDSWGAWSLQLPGFAAAQPTAEELRAALPEAVAFALGGPARTPITVHVEFEISGVVVRVAQDRYRWERQHVAERLVAALAVEDQVSDLRGAPANALGDIVYVCAMPSDQVGWLARQMDPKSDWLTAVVSVADEMIWTFSFGTGHDSDGRVDEFDLPLDTPMSLLMAAGTATRARLSS
jgi:hypothetical protein